MTPLALSRFELCATLAAAILAGCGGSQPPIGAPGATLLQAPALSSTAVVRISHKSAVQRHGYKAEGSLLYVTSPFPTISTITIFRANANDPSALATISDHLSVPVGVCLDGDGTLYATNQPVSGAGWVSEYELGQTKSFRVITKGINTPYGCAIDSSGNLWVSNIGGTNVTEYLAGSIKPHLVITTGLTYPTGIAIDNVGNLYVANTVENASNVQVYAPGQKAPSRTITDGVAFPLGVAADAHNTLYVANEFYACDIEKYRFGRNHPYQTITKGLQGPNGVVVGKNGWLYVADIHGAAGCNSTSSPSAVLEFRPHSLNPSGKEITKDFYEPRGVAYYPPLLP
jgi:sugar lactone lactonase YvrE